MGFYIDITTLWSTCLLMSIICIIVWKYLAYHPGCRIRRFFNPVGHLSPFVVQKQNASYDEELRKHVQTVNESDFNLETSSINRWLIVENAGNLFAASVSVYASINDSDYSARVRALDRIITSRNSLKSSMNEYIRNETDIRNWEYARATSDYVRTKNAYRAARRAITDTSDAAALLLPSWRKRLRSFHKARVERAKKRIAATKRLSNQDIVDVFSNDVYVMASGNHYTRIPVKEVRVILHEADRRERQLVKEECWVARI